MNGHEVASHAQWLELRKQLLEKEQALTHARDELSKARRALPWQRVDKQYVFEGPSGKESLADFMFGPNAPLQQLLAEVP
jgi:predicted dithiol-disulfide oxidoreductase (DUF899 family)